MEQVRQNIAALDWSIDDETMARIGEILEPYREMP